MKKIIILLVFIFSLSINLNVLLKEDNSFDITNNRFNNYEEEYKIGVLKIVNTNFDKVLVQTTDNTFFLNHDINGNNSNVGSVFLDYRNKLGDRKLLVYGHNSKTLKEAPFHFLENYLDLTFSNKYNSLVLETTDNTFNYQLFTVMVVSNDFQHVNLNWSDAGYVDHIAWLKNNSIFDFKVDVSNNDQIILFQTCYYEPNNSYLIVGWKKIA